MSTSGEVDQPPTNENEGGAKPEPKHWLEYAVFLFVILTAIGTGAAAYYTRQQWLTANDTEQRDLRAYVLSNSVRFVTYGTGLTDSSDRRWTVTPVIENTGSTPARKLRIVSSLNLFPDQPTHEGINNAFKWEKYPESMFVPYLVGPKSDVTGAIILVDKVTYNKIKARPVLGVFGVGKYRDVFDRAHLLEFCYAVALPAVDFDNFPLGQVIRVAGEACAEHNCSDDDCGPDWEKRAKQ